MKVVSKMAENIVGSLSNLESMLNLFATELIESAQICEEMEGGCNTVEKDRENNNSITELDKEETSSCVDCGSSENGDGSSAMSDVSKEGLMKGKPGLFYRNRPNMLNSLNSVTKDCLESGLMPESPRTVSEDSLDGDRSRSEMYEADISSEETDIHSFSESLSGQDKYHLSGKKYDDKGGFNMHNHLLLDHPYSARVKARDDDTGSISTSYFTNSDVDNQGLDDSLEAPPSKLEQICSDSGFSVQDLEKDHEQSRDVYIENVQYFVPTERDLCPLIQSDCSLNREGHMSSDSLEHENVHSALKKSVTGDKCIRKNSDGSLKSPGIIVSEFFPDVSFQSIYPADISSEGNSSCNGYQDNTKPKKTGICSEEAEITIQQNEENENSSSESVQDMSDSEGSLVFAKCKRPIICSEFPVGGIENWYNDDDSMDESENEVELEEQEHIKQKKTVVPQQSRLHDILTAELGQGQLLHWEDDKKSSEQIETESKLHEILAAELSQIKISQGLSESVGELKRDKQKVVTLQGVTTDSTETEEHKLLETGENSDTKTEAGYLKVDKTVDKTDLLDKHPCSPAGSSFEVLRNEANTDESSMSESISFTNSQIIDLSLSPGPIPSKYYSSPVDSYTSVTDISCISSIPPKDKEGDVSDEEFENDSLEDPDDFTFSSLNIGDDGNCDTQSWERRIKSEPTYFKYSDVNVENKAEEKAKKLLAKEKFVFGALADCEIDLSHEPVPQIIHDNPLKPIRSIMKSSQSSTDEILSGGKGFRKSSVDSERKSVSFDENVAQIGLIMCDYDSLDDDIWHNYDESSTAF